MKAFGFRPKLYTALKNYSKELFMADPVSYTHLANTSFAQGGIASVTNLAVDNFEKHIEDTMICLLYTSNQRTGQVLTFSVNTDYAYTGIRPDPTGTHLASLNSGIAVSYPHLYRHTTPQQPGDNLPFRYACPSTCPIHSRRTDLDPRCV